MHNPKLPNMRTVLLLTVSTPLPSGSAEIYLPPFPVGRPRYIICLQNGLAGIYLPPFPADWPRYIHTPSQWVGQDISTPLPSGLAKIYISTPLPSGSAR